MMSHQMQRTPEPEKMTDMEEHFYALADYSVPHENLACQIVETVRNRRAAALDIGCGPGDVLIRIRTHAPEWSLYGADMSASMLAFAAKDAAARVKAGAARPINWVLADAKGSGFDDSFFDAVISNSVLHHVDDAVDFWREIKRVARPNGWVFVRDLRRPPNPAAAEDIMRRNVGKESPVVQQHYLSSLHSAYTADEIAAQLRAAGLTGLTVRELEDRYVDVHGRVEKSA